MPQKSYLLQHFNWFRHTFWTIFHSWSKDLLHFLGLIFLNLIFNKYLFFHLFPVRSHIRLCCYRLSRLSGLFAGFRNALLQLVQFDVETWQQAEVSLIAPPIT